MQNAKAESPSALENILYINIWFLEKLKVLKGSDIASYSPLIHSVALCLQASPPPTFAKYPNKSVFTISTISYFAECMGSPKNSPNFSNERATRILDHSRPFYTAPPWKVDVIIHNIFKCVNCRPWRLQCSFIQPLVSWMSRDSQTFGFSMSRRLCFRLFSLLSCMKMKLSIDRSFMVNASRLKADGSRLMAHGSCLMTYGREKGCAREHGPRGADASSLLAMSHESWAMRLQPWAMKN